ncbi:MAG: gluconokinase [Ginsengibacter sp.]
MEQYAIGIDIGTGSVKALALTLSGTVIANLQKHHPTISPENGYSEQDPDLIFKIFIDLINDVLYNVGYAPEVIGLSSCMHSLICIDKHHTPISPLITWADNRAAPIAEGFRTSGMAKKIYNRSGAPVHSMLPFCKIIWMKENSADLFKRTAKFISIKEYIWYRLFKSYEVDESIASATGLFNTSKRQWDKTLLKLCSIEPGRLSEIISTNSLSIYNNQLEILKVDKAIAFCIGASDGCLANLGVNALRPGIAALTIGTSGAVRVASQQVLLNSATMLFNYVLDQNTFIIGGPVNNGGNVVPWLLKTFLQKNKATVEDYNNLFTTIKSVPAGCDGLVFLPYINGERCPVWDEHSSGIFIGVRAYHSTLHFLRAGIESVCYALKNILEELQLHNSIKQVNVTGGFINSSEWLQMLTDILNKKINVMPEQDASARGAAILAFKSIDILKTYKFPSGKIQILKPDKKLQLIYNKQYSVYKTLYNSNANQMHVLNKS